MALAWLVPAGLLLAGVGTAATGLAPSYPALLTIVIITGLGVATFHPQAAKSVYEVSAMHSRGRSMSIYSLGGNLGQACGSVFMMALLALPGAISNTLYFASQPLSFLRCSGGICPRHHPNLSRPPS